ncbi:mammalian cell entry protein [Thermaurantimonas aggregans]|uniref:Mammalian cell entry protein n=1 Tax=Thermaurantimonas aggregans TaxID=2173829 RepID=A0A401XMD5_9FLAO|nr:MlaD family protein [Thermaurantimonas aggregans]GCD78164.1 mammalian cell entry protein [Thermaurantimonas aggregans]
MKFSREFKAGSIALITIAFLYWGINFLKGNDIFVTKTSYYALYDNVNGLARAQAVILNGYNVGQVESISFLDATGSKLIVEFSLREKIKLPKNTIAMISTTDLLSGKSIVLKPGDSPELLKEGDTLQSALDNGFAEELVQLKDNFENIAHNIDSLLTKVNHILDENNVRNLNRSIAKINEVIDQNTQRISTIVSNLEKLTQTLSANNSALNRTLNNAAAITDSLKAENPARLVASLQQATDELNKLLAEIQAGKGNLGKLTQDSTLYDNLRITTDQLNKLLIDLKYNPRRYIHVSVFGKKSKPYSDEEVREKFKNEKPLKP